MPPKKKKGGGGGGDDPNKTVAVPKSFKISRQLDQEKIDFLTKRINDILTSNNELRTTSSRNEKDTHDIVLYFQREMEMKDDIISRLNEELVKRETQLKMEVEKMRKKFEEGLAQLRDSSDETIQDLTNQLAKVNADLSAIAHYQEERDAYELKMAATQRALQDQRQEMFDSLDEQERKFLEEKAAVWKEVDEQKALFREVALKEAREIMGEEVKRVVIDNQRMKEELKFHTLNSAELTTERAQLQAEMVKAKRDVAILSDKELEYAKQGYLKSKEIKALRERVEHLEKLQVTNTETFRHKTKEMQATVSRELEEATLDAAGLRRLLKLKNRELLNMKQLAATIIAQRTETEQFFLESLAEVKDIVRKEKRRTAVETKIVLSKLRGGAGTRGASVGGGQAPASSKGQGGVTFPSLNVKGPNLHYLDNRDHSALPTGGGGGASLLGGLEAVHVRDLTWDDKELVLRVLFAKMNGQDKQLPKAPKAGGGGLMPTSLPVSDYFAPLLLFLLFIPPLASPLARCLSRRLTFSPLPSFSLFFFFFLPSPQVFISEGGGSVLPPSEHAANVRFQDNFEVLGGSLAYGEEEREYGDDEDYLGPDDDEEQL